MNRKAKGILLVAIVTGSSFGFLYVELSNEPIVTSVVSQTNDSIPYSNYTYSNITQLSAFGDSEILHVLFTPPNKTLWGEDYSTELQVFKASQNIASPSSAMTFSVVYVKEIIQNVSNSLPLSGTMATQAGTIRYLYTTSYGAPGDFSAMFIIGLKPIVEWGPIHFDGSLTTIRFSQNLTVYSTPP